MITIYFKTLKDRKFHKIESVRAGSWINIENATIEDLEKLVEITGMSKADLHDSLDNFEVPRIERHEKGTLMYVRTPSFGTTGLYTDLLTIVVTDKHLITISKGKSKVISLMLEQNMPVATTQKSKLVLRMLLLMANEYTAQIKSLRTSVYMSAKDFSSINNEDFIKLAQNEEVLNQYITALVPMNNVFEAIRSGQFIQIYAEDESHMQDLLIGIKQSADICTVNLRSIRSIRDSHQVIFTNNLNKIIKLFTSLTVVLTIPTIISSLYGMNVRLPLSEHPFAFPIITLSTLIVSLSVLLLLYYKKWL